MKALPAMSADSFYITNNLYESLFRYVSTKLEVNIIKIPQLPTGERI